MKRMSFFRHCLCFAAFLLVSSAALAVPAKREWRTFTQPDGTTVEVMLVGDEWYHYYVNRDGQKMRQNDAGYWCTITDDEFDRGRDAKRTKITAPRRLEMHVGESLQLDIHTNSSGAISFYADDPDIVSIESMMGTITAIKEGWVQVLVEVSPTRDYRHATRTIRLHVLP